MFNTAADTVKGRNLARDPRLALCVDDDTPPFTFVVIEGTATLEEDPDVLRHWATVIGGRYMGDDQAEAYGARNGVPGELVVRLRPDPHHRLGQGGGLIDPPGWYVYRPVAALAEWDGTAWTGSTHEAAVAPDFPALPGRSPSSASHGRGGCSSASCWSSCRES